MTENSSSDSAMSFDSDDPEYKYIPGIVTLPLNYHEECENVETSTIVAKTGFEKKTGFDKLKEESSEDLRKEMNELKENKRDLADRINNEGVTKDNVEELMERRKELIKKDRDLLERIWKLENKLDWVELIAIGVLGLWLSPVVSDMANAGWRSLGRRF
ncbi:hypothetical protein AC249_AIPGENE19284 [Exaiptasia diaphana]|nr:hypothetical protein AC249_AIPGENE19284 [Exaiptasia diaphana]